MASMDRLIETLGLRQALKSGSEDDAALIDRVRAGLPASALEAVAERFGIPSVTLVRILRLPPRTLVRRRRTGVLTADESDRLLRLGRIVALADDVLGGHTKAARWLREPNRALSNVAPLDRLDTDLGAKGVEELLVRIAHGVPS